MFNDLVTLHYFLKIAQNAPGRNTNQPHVIGGSPIPTPVTLATSLPKQIKETTTGLPSLASSTNLMLRRAALMNELARPVPVQDQRQGQLTSAWNKYNRAVTNVNMQQR